MKTRTGKYEVAGPKSRTARNERLYEDVSSITVDYEYNPLDNAVDLSSPKKDRASREDYQKQRELDKLIPRERQSKSFEIEDIEPKEDRVYDINEILKMAKENTLLEDEQKKLNTEYNILTKLDVEALDNEQLKKEERRSLVDDIYGKEKKKKKKKKDDIEEDTDLLSNLMPSKDNPEDTISNEIKLDEVMKAKIMDTKEHTKTEDEIATQLESITVTDIDLEHTKELLNTKKHLKKEEKRAKKEKKKKKKDDEFVFTTDKMPVVDTLNEAKENKRIKKSKYDTSEFEYEGDGKGLMIAIIIITVLIFITIGFFIYEYFFV